jgi:acyl-coenzyme A synthetase/AMP-(fatty) acid ligase
LAGEPLADSLVQQWRRFTSRECRVINLYGPTETTMVKCWAEVPDPVPAGIQAVGHPLPESQALVVTAGGRLCGVMEPGEIVLRTPFATRGYINAAEEQALRFVTNPFTGRTEDVVYRTGDLGRFRADGSLMILGRLDHQVKIRGVRIEPQEVAAVLAQHSAVRGAAVIAREIEGQGLALVAYVVADPAQASAAALRAFLADRLPAAFIPSTIVFLERLPVTPNGKLDRAALPEPAEPVRKARDRVAPRTPVETLLAEIWAEVLGADGVGVHDDFFELGGQSLRATQMIARARAVFQVELPLRSLFEAPTVAGLALIVTRRLLETAGASA